MPHWLMQFYGNTPARVAAGVSILMVLAAVDLSRHGAQARRWREYGVLMAAVAAAIAYGIVNDQITSTISWEYFFYGKSLEAVLGAATPPDMAALRWQAVRIGAEASWSAGLLFGVVLLLVNNPMGEAPRLRNRELVRLLPLIVMIAIIFGAIFGLAGWRGWLTGVSADFEGMVRENLFRPRRFMTAWGVHLGGYIGGLIGTIIAAGRVAVLRRRRGRQSRLVS